MEKFKKMLSKQEKSKYFQKFPHLHVPQEVRESERPQQSTCMLLGKHFITLQNEATLLPNL